MTLAEPNLPLPSPPKVQSNQIFFHITDEPPLLTNGLCESWPPLLVNVPENFFYHISLTFNFQGWTMFTSTSSGIMFLSTPRLPQRTLCNIRWGLRDLTPIISECPRELFYHISLTFNFHRWTKFTSKSSGIMFLSTPRLSLMILFNIRWGLRKKRPKKPLKFGLQQMYYYKSYLRLNSCYNIIAAINIILIAAIICALKIKIFHKVITLVEPNLPLPSPLEVQSNQIFFHITDEPPLLTKFVLTLSYFF